MTRVWLPLSHCRGCLLTMEIKVKLSMPYENRIRRSVCSWYLYGGTVEDPLNGTTSSTTTVKHDLILSWLVDIHRSRF